MKKSLCLVFCILCLTACGGSGSTPQTGQDQPELEEASEQSVPVKAPDIPKPAALSETDRLMLDQAKTACKNADFKQFFEAVLRAQPVREGRVRQGGVISAVAVGHRQAALAVMCRG